MKSEIGDPIRPTLRPRPKFPFPRLTSVLPVGTLLCWIGYLDLGLLFSFSHVPVLLNSIAHISLRRANLQLPSAIYTVLFYQTGKSLYVVMHETEFCRSLKVENRIVWFKKWKSRGPTHNHIKCTCAINLFKDNKQPILSMADHNKQPYLLIM